LRTAHGGLWQASGLRFILKNRTYLGELVSYKQQSGRYYRVCGGEVTEVKTVNAPCTWSSEADLIVCKGTHKPLIDRATFDAVQARLVRQRTGPRRSSDAVPRYTLGGLFECGFCGSKLRGSNRAAGGKTTYTCEKRWTFGTSFCRPNMVKEGEILNLVLDAVESRFLPSPTCKFI